MSDEKQDKGISILREYVDSLLVTVILALFGITFLVQAFKIPSQSMEETLLVGDHLLVNKFVFAETNGGGPPLLPYRDVRRGDIIVFKYPFAPYQHFVKRVVGVPGDRLRIVERQVIINGEALDEPYKIHRRPQSAGNFQDNFPPSEDYFAYGLEDEWMGELARATRDDELVVPPAKYFVMGDNRDNSQDSRYWGTVPRANIVGRAMFVYWSMDPSKDAGDSGMIRDFFTKSQWSRTGKFIK